MIDNDYNNLHNFSNDKPLIKKRKTTEKRKIILLDQAIYCGQTISIMTNKIVAFYYSNILIKVDVCFLLSLKYATVVD